MSYAEYFFHQGTNIRAYDYMGAHRQPDGSVYFRVWAPKADKVYVAGDFNGWGKSVPMTRESAGGVWGASVDGLSDGEKYKFLVCSSAGEHFKSDPYAFYSETGMHTASILYTLPDYNWTDSAYAESRRPFADCRENDDMPPVPVNIYEVHLGSWMKNSDGSPLSYRDAADRLADYVSDMGYTHIELMPIAEHPFDGSWGYQICGYYAPTSRYGTPEDFMYFVDRMHSRGVGVILDWVPAHFPKDEHGLYEFDGGPLYEYSDPKRMENRGWGTRCFDVGRNEVACFLISNAVFWLEKYHIDGLRIDAVASMLYLDYDRGIGEWTPNVHGGNENLESIAFFQKLNKCLYDNYPDRMMIAEESTAFPDVTKRHGLGFTFKWNMGWMNDTLSYLSVDPFFRSGCHEKMTFSMMYAFSENYVLPLSHDEVVHGKRSLIDRCSGDYDAKFATLRTYFAYMTAHPGKKLTFMGGEIAQFREWDYEGQIEWFLLDYPQHRAFKSYIRDLNRLYASDPAFWRQDRSWEGFSWIDANDRNGNTLVFARDSGAGSRVIAVLNFAAKMHEGRTIPVGAPGNWEIILCSDDKRYGGSGLLRKKKYRAAKAADGGYAITVSVPPLSALYIKRRSGQTR